MKMTPRRAALEVLMRVEADGSYMNLALAAALQKGGFEEEQRAFVSALVRGVLENRLAIDYALGTFSRTPLKKMDPDVRNILRLGVCQLGFLDGVSNYAAVNESVTLAKSPHTRGFVNGVLRAVGRTLEKGSLPLPEEEKDRDAYLEITYSCPKWIIMKWRRDYGEEKTMQILASLKERPRRFARVNTLKTTAQELLNHFGGTAAAEELSENCLRFESLPRLETDEAFRQGFYHMQGLGSQLCCEAVAAQPSDTVLDLCAAPGGKSFTMAEQMQNHGRVLACELHENRLSLIAQGARRLGISIIETKQNDASRPNPSLGEFDRVLCDVPCSGLGVLHAKPEIRFRPQEALEPLPRLQYQILCEGAAHVRHGGTLVYSTCTLSFDENEAVAGRFLAEHSEYEPLDLPKAFHAQGHCLTLFPGEAGAEGFFIARFRRV